MRRILPVARLGCQEDKSIEHENERICHSCYLIIPVLTQVDKMTKRLFTNNLYISILQKHKY